MFRSFPSHKVFGLAVILAGLATFSLRAYSLDLLPHWFSSKDKDGIAVFDGGDQYVKLVPRERTGGASGANDQPVNFTSNQIRTALAQLEINHVTGLFEDKVEAIPVFSASELNVLGDALARALKIAKPDQDILFRVVSLHEGKFFKNRLSTSGRVFYQGGRLNLIFGDFHRELTETNEQKARNLKAGCGDCPVSPTLDTPKIASRGDASKLSDAILQMDGLQFPTVGDSVRSDWLVLNVQQILADVEREKNKLPPALAKEQRRAKQEAAKANVERLQMREEMARMRKQMEDLKNGTDTRSVEERLATLQDLKKKGLISDQEFETRRKQILNNL